MLKSIARFMRDEEGATAIEYGIIAGLMAVVLIAVFGTGSTSVTTALKSAFTSISTSLNGV